MVVCWIEAGRVTSESIESRRTRNAADEDDAQGPEIGGDEDSDEDHHQETTTRHSLAYQVNDGNANTDATAAEAAMTHSSTRVNDDLGDGTSNQRLQYAAALTSRIRFMLMSADELADHVEPVAFMREVPIFTLLFMLLCAVLSN